MKNPSNLLPLNPVNCKKTLFPAIIPSVFKTPPLPWVLNLNEDEPNNIPQIFVTPWPGYLPQETLSEAIGFFPNPERRIPRNFPGTPRKIIKEPFQEVQ